MPTNLTTQPNITCFDCDRSIPRQASSSVYGDERVCDTCIDNYMVCDNCNISFHYESREWSGGSNGYCYDCSSSDEEIPFPHRPWKEDTNLITERRGKILNSTRVFGVESEVGYHDDTALLTRIVKGIHPNIGITEDSGAEFQTPPASGYKAEALITDMTRQWHAGKFTAQNGQGLHVHVDASELKALPAADYFNRVKGLWLLYIVFDKTIRSFTNHYRQERAVTGCMFKGNEFPFEMIANATSIRELERIWYDSEDIEQIENRKKERKNGTRYKGFNLHSLFNAYHLEIRYHESVLEAEAILEWANLHCLMMDKAIAGIDLAWLEKVNQKKFKRKILFDFLNLSDDSRKYFRKKTLICAA